MCSRCRWVCAPFAGLPLLNSATLRFSPPGRQAGSFACVCSKCSPCRASSAAALPMFVAVPFKSLLFCCFRL
uniref:Secreted protein n=1 Tax=Zea mays TaxID=4577 RepID=C4IZP3_MAIZE|nr:unknown [Zea mays]